MSSTMRETLKRGYGYVKDIKVPQKESYKVGV